MKKGNFEVKQIGLEMANYRPTRSTEKCCLSLFWVRFCLCEREKAKWLKVPTADDQQDRQHDRLGPGEGGRSGAATGSGRAGKTEWTSWEKSKRRMYQINRIRFDNQLTMSRSIEFERQSDIWQSNRAKVITAGQMMTSRLRQTKVT
jgi:hypothetical protein